MVSGLTPPSKRDNDDKRDANIESLRDSVRFSAPTTNVLNTMGSKVGGGGSQIVPSIQGLFATNPSEIPESIELTYTESTTTSPLKTGDEVTSSINGWKGKLIRVTNTNVNNNINRKEALFSNTSTVTFSNASQNIVKTGWSAAYLINTQTENALVLSSSAPIVSTSLTGGNPIIKQIYGTTNNGQILFMKPKDGKTLTLKASTGVYPNVVGNIDMSADVTVNDDSFVILQYFADVNNTANDVTGRYLLLSGGGSSTGMNNPATAQLDMAAFSIKGAWGGTTDTLGIQSDLDMTTYDIIDLDRLKFSTIAGSGTALTSSNTGIEALYNAGNPFGMLIQFPNTNSAVMQIKRGTVDMINISSLGVLLGDELLMGGHKITNLGTPTATTDAATKAYVDASGGSTSFIGFTADANLAMGTYNIEGLDQLIFSTATSSDLPVWNNANYGIEVEGGTTPTALDIRVPSGKFVNVKVASTIEFTFKGNELDCINNDICNVGTIFTDYIATSSGNTNVRVWGHLDPISDGDYDLGSTSLYWRTLRLDGPLYTRGSIYLLGTSKFIDMNANNLVFSTGGRVDFAADTGTPSGAGGYVRVKIGGVDKWMPYYS